MNHGLIIHCQMPIAIMVKNVIANKVHYFNILAYLIKSIEYIVVLYFQYFSTVLGNMSITNLYYHYYLFAKPIFLMFIIPC